MNGHALRTHFKAIRVANGRPPRIAAPTFMPTAGPVVAVTGSDTAAGSAAAPYATIAKALTKAAAGETIYLRGGTYAERVVVNKSVSIAAWDAEPVTIRPASGAQTECLFIQNTSNVLIDGVIIDAVNRRKGVSVSFSHDVTIQNCEIKNCYGQAAGQYGHGIVIADDGGCYSINILNCHIHHIGGVASAYGLCHALYVAVNDVVIRGCELDHVDGNGINWSGTGGNLLAEQNYSHDNAIGIGIYIGTALCRNNVLRDNTVHLMARYHVAEALFYHNTCMGGVLGLDAKNFYLSGYAEAKNNVFDNMSQAVAAIPSTGSVLCSNSLRSRITNVDTVGSGATVSSISGAFTPITDDAATGITIAAGNPAIGAGVWLADVPRDYGGFAHRNPPALGAWEYVS